MRAGRRRARFPALFCRARGLQRADVNDLRADVNDLRGLMDVMQDELQMQAETATPAAPPSSDE